ncbi:unnamed protein product [Prorocentrum cordatum]|uniref:ADP,ATP carrier protein n=1 Tax=Prorocentrum cordatum TaxID=2364126 RepID=A0ABN9XZH3_9DINO|nr:unnamed protein product [Polarella glacialis]
MVKCNTQGSRVPLAETFWQLWHAHGARMLYRGFLACAARDVGQTAAYFGLAEFFGRSEYLQRQFGSHAALIAGMLTGLGHCHVELPFDCIKTRMHTNWEYRGYADCMRDVFQDGPFVGFRRLFRGYLPWMSRAMLCHGASFWAIAQARRVAGL